MTSDVTFNELSALDAEVLPERTVLAATGIIDGLLGGGSATSGILPLGKGNLVQRL